jgi:hypothetical protein
MTASSVPRYHQTAATSAASGSSSCSQKQPGLESPLHHATQSPSRTRDAGEAISHTMCTWTPPLPTHTFVDVRFIAYNKNPDNTELAASNGHCLLVPSSKPRQGQVLHTAIHSQQTRRAKVGTTRTPTNLPPLTSHTPTVTNTHTSTVLTRMNVEVHAPRCQASHLRRCQGTRRVHERSHGKRADHVSIGPRT